MKKKTIFATALVSLLGFSVGVFGAGYAYPLIQWAINGTAGRTNTTEFQVQTPSAGAAAIFAPGTNNVNALGSTSLRFSNVYTQLLNVAGATTQSGALTVGGALTVTGLTKTSGGLQLFVSSAPRTATDAGALTISSGTLVYNSTDGGLCFATATVQTSFVAATAPTSACGH